MHKDKLDINNINRKDELRSICDYASKMITFDHFTAHVVTRLFKNEAEKIEKKYSQLKVEPLAGNVLSNQTAISCTISKK